MVTTAELRQALLSTGASGFEISFQSLNLDSDLMKIKAVSKDRRIHPKINAALGKLFVAITERSAVLDESFEYDQYSNVFFGAYAIPAGSVIEVSVDMSNAVTTITLTSTDDKSDIDSKYESSGAVSVTTKRKGR
jgi:hypothetical protein